MAPYRMLTKIALSCLLAGSLAGACPLGDCSGEHRTLPAGDGAARQGVPIFSGLTGTHASRVDLTGTDITPGRVAVLLEHRTGAYPRFWRDTSYHGGIPQRADLRAHLEKLARDLDREIPDRNFDGYAVIDYESWKPFWDTTWSNRDFYREESIRHVRARFPTMGQAQAEALARQEFETAAREFMLATLREGKRLRPNAKWGFYAYMPGRHGDTGLDDDLSWMWSEVDAMYPSIYARNYSKAEQTRARGEWHIDQFRAVVRERIEACASVGQGKPMLAFVHRLYRSDNPIYGGQVLNDLDFEASFVYSVELGVDGLILWDAVNSVSAARSIENDLRRGTLGQRISEAQIVDGGAGGGVVAPERRRAGQ